MRKLLWLMVLLVCGCGTSDPAPAPATPEDEKAAEQRIKDEAARERKARQGQKKSAPDPADR